MQDKQNITAAEQAAWHAGLDEGLAQATGSVSNATCHQAKTGFSVSNAETPQAAPAAVAVSMAEAWELSAADAEQQTTGAGQDYNQGVAEGLRICAKDLRAALAATPANGDSLEQLNKNKDLAVVLPEPSRWLMRDNHTFRKLPGDNAAALSVILLEFDAGYSHSSLFTHDSSGKTIEDCVHCHGKREPLETEARAWLNRTSALLAGVSAPAAPAPNWDALRHSANEWADMATSGLQWLRNIVDGISDPKAALENMESNLVHCRSVNDAPEVQAAVKAAAPQAQADARDAERYRYLRDEHIGDDPESISLKPARMPGLDASIDAAIAAAKGE